MVYYETAVHVRFCIAFACICATDIAPLCEAIIAASIAARTLKDYGFTNVSILDGGNQAWGEAGLPLEQV